jgi:hypothetical protein
MNFYIFFETALPLLATAYLVPIIMLLAVSDTGIAVIEMIEKLSDCSKKNTKDLLKNCSFKIGSTVLFVKLKYAFKFTM